MCMTKLFTSAAMLLFAVGCKKVHDSDAANKPYMVIDLMRGPTENISYLDDVPEGGWTTVHKTTSLVLRRISAGVFEMGGCPQNEWDDDHLIGGWGSEPFFNGRSRTVAVTRPFYIGVFEVTQRQYKLVTGENPSQWVDDLQPVNMVRWTDICGVDGDSECSFLGRLRRMVGNERMDLPTEAQWELSCRSPAGYARETGDVAKYGSCWENSSGLFGSNNVPRHVGAFIPNGNGVYDMQGNVWEWCRDVHGPIDYSCCTNPIGCGDSSFRTLKGGSWRVEAAVCLPSFRYTMPKTSRNDETGFRVVWEP